MEEDQIDEKDTDMFYHKRTEFSEEGEELFAQSQDKEFHRLQQPE